MPQTFHGNLSLSTISKEEGVTFNISHSNAAAVCIIDAAHQTLAHSPPIIQGWVGSLFLWCGMGFGPEVLARVGSGLGLCVRGQFGPLIFAEFSSFFINFSAKTILYPKSCPGRVKPLKNAGQIFGSDFDSTQPYTNTYLKSMLVFDCINNF